MRHGTHFDDKSNTITQTHRFSISAWISFGPSVSFNSLSKHKCETFSRWHMYRDTVFSVTDGVHLVLYLSLGVTQTDASLCIQHRNKFHCLICIVHNIKQWCEIQNRWNRFMTGGKKIIIRPYRNSRLSSEALFSRKSSQTLNRGQNTSLTNNSYSTTYDGNCFSSKINI